MTRIETEKRWGDSNRTDRCWGAIALALASIALLVACSDDAPVTPEPVAYNIYVSATDYLYLGGGNHNGFYVYDADSLTLIDSIPLPHIGGSVEVSPDGRYLYSVLWRYKDPPHDYYLAKIDVSTSDMVWTQNNVGGPDLSPSLLDDGRLILYGRLQIDAASGELIRETNYFETSRWTLFYGPASGRKVAAVVVDSVSHIGTKVIAVDVVSGKAYGLFEPQLAPNQPFIGPYYARLHPDGRRVLIVGPRTDVQDSWFLVGDLISGELLFSAHLSTPYGEIAISLDGTMAVVVDEADAFFGIGVPAVYIYDLVNYQHLRTFDPYNDLVYWPGQVRFLPGDRRIAIFPPNSATGVGWLQIFDLNTMTREYAVAAPFASPDAGGIAIGPRPSP